METEIENTIAYRGETYSVKNNGEIFRHARAEKRKRKDDEIWTFGIGVDDKGFYTIGNHKIHAIVATAFHGEQLSPQYVVFHKNYNKKDNRSDNLMWVTKFQFHIFQPNVQAQLRIVTKKKRFEEILENFDDIKSVLPPNLFWMNAVSSEDVFKTLELYKELKFEEKKEAKDIKSLTPNAVQRNNWWIKCEFPCCPTDSVKNSLQTYFDNLNENSIFCKNNYYKSKICKFSFNKDHTAIIIKCTDAEDESIKPYKLAQITYENNVYVHKNLGTFFHENGAEKYYTIAIGDEWTGGEVFDDFC